MGSVTVDMSWRLRSALRIHRRPRGRSCLVPQDDPETSRPPSPRPGAPRPANHRRVTPGEADLERAAAALAWRLPEPAGSARPHRLQLPLGVDAGRLGALPLHRPAPLAPRRRQPRAAAPGGVDRGADRAPPRTPSCSGARPRSSRRCTPTSRASPAARSDPDAPRRLLLRGVRRPPVAADLLGRPRRARGRHPQGGVRPRAAVRRRRPDVPPRLLPPAHRRDRLAAGVLGARPTPSACPPPSSPATTASRSRSRCRSATSRRPRRCGACRSAASRCSCSTRSATRTTASSRWITSRLYDADPDTRLVAVRAARPRRRRGARAARDRPRRRAPQRGPRRVRLAGPGAHRDERRRAVVRRRARRRRAAARSSPPTRRSRRATTPTRPTRSRARCAPYLDELGVDADDVVRRGRTHPDDGGEPFGVTQFALRTSRAANGVSRRHGEVARDMWQGLWPDRAVEDVPITHVTNGVHIPSWVGAPMRQLLDRHLGDGWAQRADDPATWQPLDNATGRRAVGRAHRAARSGSSTYVRERSVVDRLARGDAAPVRRRPPRARSTPTRSPSASPAASRPTSG